LSCSQDHTSPGDRLLDLLVYAPAGLALTMAEELPALVEKGRNRIEGRVATARMVGQFAVQMGLREAGRRVRQVIDQQPGSAPGGTRVPEARVVKAPAEGRVPERRVPERRMPASPVPEARVPGARVQESVDHDGGAAGVRGGELAIPAYDTLSASQVVKRLAGLSVEELEEVAAYERANRHRATVLNRVEQLLSG